MKSLFDEIDRPNPDTYRSNPNAPESTAAECLKGAGISLDDAIGVRTLAYRRFTDWRGDRRANRDLVKRIESREIKRATLAEGVQAELNEYLTLESDRSRSEFEVAHWRGLVDWWRARDAQGLELTYGGSRSMRDLIQGLAQAKGSP